MIDTPAALADLVGRLAPLDRLGLDTEADSLHAYREKVCLVQVGLPDADELVDPLAGLDLSPLLDRLSRLEIVLHGADFDLRQLYRLGLDRPGAVFDTALAARLTGARAFGYAALVAEHFGVTLPKGSQKANWGRRPLTPTLADYARRDTHFLLPLAERLERRLDELGRRSWLEQSCRRAVAAARVVRERDPDTEWRVRGSHILGPRAGAILRALWRWREDEACRIDRPPFYVLANEALVDAARRLDLGEAVAVRHLRGARRARFDRAADAAQRLDRAAWPTPRATPPRPRRTAVQQRQIAALKQRRDQAARDLAIDADLIASRAALERLAVTGPDGDTSLLPWQRTLLQDGA